MTRQEARARLDAATAFLKANGHSQKELERLLDGLLREDAVEVAELRVKWVQRGCPDAEGL